jgi:hypothetical protein
MGASAQPEAQAEHYLIYLQIRERVPLINFIE